MNTENLLRESPNFGPLIHKHKQGLFAERQAAEYYSKFAKILAHRLKTPFAELDLLVLCGRKIIIVEVKSIKSPEFASTLLTDRQLQRLIRAHAFLQNYLNCNCELELALVYPNQKIEILSYPWS